MRNILDPILGFINRYRPEHAGRYVMPYLVFALTFLLILGAVQIKKSHDQNAETRHALCALRADLEQRVDNSRDFLRVHPKGAFGIPASTLRVTLEGQERSVQVLSSLSC